MKKLATLVMGLFLMVSVSGVYAQASDCNIKYNLFKGDFKAKKFDAAYDNWMWCMDNCPTLSVNIYKYGIGIAEYKYENASAGDKAAAEAIVRRVFDQRIQHYPTDLGKVYSNYATFLAETGASEDEVFTMIEKSFKADPTRTAPKNIYKYFDIILNKYKDSDTQKVFDTYDDVGDAIELKRAVYSKKIEAINKNELQGHKIGAKDAKNKAIYQQIIKNLSIVETGLDVKLAEISTCERLIPFNKRYFDEMRSDKVWLKRAVSRMYKKGCTDDDFYDVLVEAYVAADPSPEASVFYAGILMKKGDIAKATEYFKQAVEQETDSYKKGNYLFKIAQIMKKRGRKSEARNYAYQSLKAAPTMGKAYLLIGSMYAQSANSCGENEFEKRMVYVAALEKARKAKSVDPSIGSLANKFIRSYQSNIPKKKDIFVMGLNSGDSFKVKCWIGETVKIP